MFSGGCLSILCWSDIHGAHDCCHDLHAQAEAVLETLPLPQGGHVRPDILAFFEQFLLLVAQRDAELFLVLHDQGLDLPDL